MLTASNLYKQTIQTSHRRAVTARLWNLGTEVGTLQITSGTWTFDGNARHRRQCDVRVAVDPYGTESRDVLEQASMENGYITIDFGVTNTDGTVETVQLGRLRIQTWERQERSHEARITAFDRTVMMEPGVIDHLVLGPALTPLVSWKSALSLIVGHSFPVYGVSLTFDPSLPDFAIGAGEYVGTERFDLIEQWCEKAGAHLIADNEGNLHVKPLTLNPTGVASWAIGPGAGGTLVDVTQKFDRTEQFNSVFLRWASSENGETYWGFATDDDPSSPTRYGGPFGRKTLQVDDVPVSSSAEALAKAQEYLARYAGVSRGLEVTATTCPLIEPDDTIGVFVNDTWEPHIVDKITYALGAESTDMTVETRLIRGASYTPPGGL